MGNSRNAKGPNTSWSIFMAHGTKMIYTGSLECIGIKSKVHVSGPLICRLAKFSYIAT